MSFGFQCFNDAGAFQVDGVYPQFAFKRKETVSCSTTNRGTSTIPYYTGDFTIANDELAAIVSGTKCAIVRRAGGVARIAAVANASVTVYIFGGVTAIGSTWGLQVFNSSGTLVFDASQKPLAMVGFPVGEGDFSYNASKSYAALCMNQYFYVTSTGHSNGSDHRVTYTMGMVKSISGGINISNVLMYDDTESMDPNQGAFDESVPANSVNRHIIIDVTNY